MKKYQVNKTSYDTFGKLLVKIQFFEELVKIFVSLYNDETKSKNKRIKNLSYKDILNDDIPNRKQTLGILMSAVKSEIKHFNNSEFDELLEKRNIFVHKFHKLYLAENVNKDKELNEFILRLWELTNKYTDIFTGLNSLSIRLVTKNKIDASGISNYEKNILEYLK